MIQPPVESRRLRAFVRAALRGGPTRIDRAFGRLTHGGLPLIERIPGDRRNRLVTFVWRPTRHVRTPSVETTVGDPDLRRKGLRPLGVGGIWYLSLRVANRTRARYGFSAFPFPPSGAGMEEWIRYERSIVPDPHNQRHFAFAKDPDDPDDFATTFSVLELPAAPRQPWSYGRASLRATEERVRLRSRYLRRLRSVWVFRPPGFDPRKHRYNLLVAFDGIAYRDMVPTPWIVEHLVATGRISPTIVVLIGNAPGGRVTELDRNPRFARFVAQEVLPWLRRRYGIAPDPRRTVIAGSSLGAVAALSIAREYPHLFGNVLAQSGAFLDFAPEKGRRRSSLMEDVAREPKLPLRIYLDAGTQESVVDPPFTTSLLGSVRHMRDVLEAKGYSVSYAEFEGGHDYTCWSSTLADGLVALLERDRPGRTG
jgi:enterochelin esterase-like enzyme